MKIQYKIVLVWIICFASVLALVQVREYLEDKEREQWNTDSWWEVIEIDGGYIINTDFPEYTTPLWQTIIEWSIHGLLFIIWISAIYLSIYSFAGLVAEFTAEKIKEDKDR